MNMNTWPMGKRKALHQDDHIKWNNNNYPGTRQLCVICGEPTERCEEDSLWDKNGNPLCSICYIRGGD